MKYFINFLTYSRVCAGPILFVLIAWMEAYGFGLFIFLLACLSDYLDGFLARKYQLTSEIGAILDPIADKILVVFMFCCLTLHLESFLIGFLGSIILAREFWVSALRDMNSRIGNMSATNVTFLAKIKTFIQMIALGSYIFGLYVNSALLIFVSDFILFLATIITLQTGLSYTIASFDKSNNKLIID